MITQIDFLVNRLLNGNAATKELRQLDVGPLMTTLVKNMELGVGKVNSSSVPYSNATTDAEYSEGNKRAYYNYWYGEVMLPALLSTLGMNNLKTSPLGAALILELHQETNREPFIRVSILEILKYTLIKVLVTSSPSARDSTSASYF